MIDALGQTTVFTYDALNRLVHRAVSGVGDPGVTTVYDALGRRIAETDQANKITSYGYDELGRLAAVTDALFQVTSYVYDKAGNMISQIDANGHATTFEYDSMGRRVKRTLPEGQIETYGYDLSGNMVSKTDFSAPGGSASGGNGKTTTYEYDPMNRLTAKIPDASFGASNIVFAYSASGQRTNMFDQSGATVYRYDVRDRLAEKATPQGALSYAYDPQGNLTNLWSSNTNGVWLAYTYDELNRLGTVNDHRAGLAAYNYDNVGNLRDVIYPNGVNHVWQYDNLNRLTNLTVNGLTNPIARYGYTLNSSGHRTTVRELSGRTVSYNYDNLYRLTQETISGSVMAGQISYGYDAVGNRQARTSTLTNVLSKLYGYDQNDRLDSDEYDAAGNTVSGAIGETPLNCSYDFENRLLSVTSVNSVVGILYDGDGNRVAKTITDGVSTHTVKYLVDERNPTGYSQVLEELISNAVNHVYTHGLDLISQDKMAVTNWVISFYAYDGHGNVRLLTDDSGAITDTYDYEAFGNLISRTGYAANNYLYCGEQFDPDIGLYFLRARYLDADRGRFWSMDTWEGRLSEPVAAHRYVYADIDPINRKDPSGMMSLAEISITLHVVQALAKLISPKISSFACGSADVSSVVDTAFTESGAFFRSITDMGSKSQYCSDLISPSRIADGWDISDLRIIGGGNYYYMNAKPGKGPCMRTVTYRGKCYHASAVNYAFYGHLHAQCRAAFPSRPQHTLANVLSFVGLYKGFFQRGAQLSEALGFTRYGYLGTKDLPDCKLKGCNVNTDLEAPRSAWNWGSHYSL